MERCPNCGATVREGARFCTACGFRLIDANEPSNDPASPPDQAKWWGPRADGEATASEVASTGSADAEPSTPAAVGDPPPSGSSFWDRIEGATGGPERTLAEPAPRWNPEADATSIEPAETPVESDNPHRTDETDDGTSTVVFAAADRDEAPRPNQAADQVSFADHRDDTGARAASPEPSGASLVSELNRVVRTLEEARSGEDTAAASRLSELEAAIHEARERPREIDAMLAISARLETISDLLSSNQRMAKAIDSALRALQGDDSA